MKPLSVLSYLVAVGCFLSTTTYAHEISRDKINLSTQDFKVKVNGSRENMNKDAYREKKRLANGNLYNDDEDKEEAIKRMKIRSGATNKYLGPGHDEGAPYKPPQFRVDPKTGKYVRIR